VPVDPILGIVADQWASIMALLAPDVRQQFLALVEQAAAADADPEDRQEIIDEIVDLLGSALPGGHPVQEALADDGAYRFVALAERDRTADPAEPPAAGPDPVLAWLRELWARSAAGAAAGEPASPAEIARAAEAQLLTAPAVSDTELRRRGGDPDQAHLIALDGPEGRRLPAFQFDASGQPIALVLDINALLDADADPWGVADWWLGRNSWLAQPPAQALGRVADAVLLDAARALAEGC
jgi:hypothetical protein